MSVRQEPQSSNDAERGTPVFGESLKLVAKTVTNPLFLFGVLFGHVAGWGLCWAVFVLPFHHNLSEREAQLEKWSQLNLQAQQRAMENHELSQTELKRFVAANQEAATSFQEVQRYLHEREIRLTETPTTYILIPICVLGITFIGVVFFFKALNQRALATVDHVLHLAPREMVYEVIGRHIMLESPRAGQLPAGGGDGARQDSEA
jgi:hypothetical protein